jgi:hypothetical protein
MSHEATNWAIKQRGLKPAAKIVLWHLADCHNRHTGRCDPSQKLLADLCEMSRSTLNAHLATLEQGGLIKRVQRADRKTRRQQSTFYVLGLDGGQPQSTQDVDDEAQDVVEPCPKSGLGTKSEQGGEPCPETGLGAVSGKSQKPCPENRDSRVRNPDTNLGREPGIEPNPLTPLEGEKEGFDLFCSVYPMDRSGNVNLRVARSDWRKAVDALGPDAVLAAGRAYAAAVAKTGQLPVGLRKFLDLNPKRGLVRQWVPKEAIVLEPARLTDSEEHQFLASARESGTAERDIRRWAEPGAFRFHREGAQMVAVVPTGELEFRRAFEALIAANHLSVWSEAFLARREERRKAQGVA